jgi:hypothetical protein
VSDKEYLRVSYSSLNLADSCLRKFEFNKLYPRRARDPDAFAADVGTALHHGYQDYLVHQNEESAMWALMRDYPYLQEWNQTRDDRSLEAAMATLDEMMHEAKMTEWEWMTIKRPDGEIVPAVEVPFELRLKGLDLPDGRGVAFTGFMDAALRHLGHGGVRTMDIKTHRRTLEDATSKYRFDSQQVPYGICLEHIQGHRIDEFEVLYLDCFVDLVNPRVHLYPFMKDSVDLQEWLINTVLRVQRIQRAMEMDYFPRTDGGCLNWNRPCYFLEVCQTREREAVLDWLLMGEEPEQRPLETPWIVAEIDVFGEAQ